MSNSPAGRAILTSDEPSEYDVGGVLLLRPFQIRRLGHFGSNCVRLAEIPDF